MQGIYCLITKGIGLNDEIRTLLYQKACEMLDKSQEYRVVKSTHCEGVIETKFGYAGMGSIWGTKFTATLDTEKGAALVEFIVHDRDFKAAMESGVWITFDSTPEERLAHNARYN